MIGALKYTNAKSFNIFKIARVLVSTWFQFRSQFITKFVNTYKPNRNSPLEQKVKANRNTRFKT